MCVTFPLYCRSLAHTYLQCEVWWVYTRQHLVDIVKAGKAKGQERWVPFDLLKIGPNDVLSLLAELRTCLKKQAWVSDHYSDEPFDSILSELFPS